ncbi:MAG: inositol monophosphatase [Oxalobacter sp.]|nr:MAG: inositol monophosphatase [Oxalobacter sp.]
MLITAVKAARRGAAVINRASMDLGQITVTEKKRNDYVTEIDQAAERAIVDVLLKAYPGHAVLAEESGASANLNAENEYVWIIDPLDGTTNFIHGFPQYCVSIALQHKGVTTQAVIFDPTRNDLFVATRGDGAFLNDKRLRVSKCDKLADSLIGTGFPARDMGKLEEYMKMFKVLTERCQGLRRPGSAALDLAYVAAGRLDGFFEKGLNSWDMAAGALLITEAGGIIGDFTGEQGYLESGDVIAGNPRIFHQLITLLKPYA